MPSSTPRPEPVDGGPDPAFAALLADPRMALRRPPPDLPIAVMRSAANRFMAQAPRPPIHATANLSVAGPAGPLAVRLHRPSNAPELPVILFCHGGGFLFGDLDTHDAMCRSLANAARAAVVAVEYRLAPEHRFPAALDDCRAALRWIGDAAAALGLDPDRVAIAGDSAGGHLAVHTALADRPVRHVAMLYPLLDPMCGSPSARALAEGYMLTRSFIQWAWENYAPGARADLPDAALAAIPGATIVTAGFDPLRDEGEAFAARLEAAGVAVARHRYPRMIHGFAGMPQFTPVAEEALAFVGERLRIALMP